MMHPLITTEKGFWHVCFYNQLQFADCEPLQ